PVYPRSPGPPAASVWRGVAVRGLMCWAAGVAGAAVVVLGPAVGVASAAGGPGTGTRLAAGARAGSGGGWGRAREVPGIAALNRAGTRRSNQCRVLRRATAAPAGITPTNLSKVGRIGHRYSCSWLAR